MNLFYELFYKDVVIEPDMCLDRLTEVTSCDIKRLGAKAVALDLDNTAVLYGSYKVGDDIKEWVSSMKNNGIRVVVITNTVFFRGHYLAGELGAEKCFAVAFKPLDFAIKRAAKKLGINTSDIVMIGDTLTTDILTANVSGARSIKLKPLSDFLPRKCKGISSIINLF